MRSMQWWSDKESVAQAGYKLDDKSQPCQGHCKSANFYQVSDDDDKIL